MPDNEETKKLIDIMANDEKRLIISICFGKYFFLFFFSFFLNFSLFFRREHMQLKLSNAILLDFERKEIPIDDKLQVISSK